MLETSFEEKEFAKEFEKTQVEKLQRCIS